MKEEYMREALELGKKGYGKVNPNPMVGAVIVKNNRIIGRGWHKEYGGFHAERNAIADCRESLKGAVLYVTLEPCCHQGKTPPCTEAIIDSGIQHVIIGTKDPNPLVSGKGIERLRQCGIRVSEGILKEECEAVNNIFFHFIKTGTPYTVMKYAMTMDGKIATVSGRSKWITGAAARWKVQEDRNHYMGIMVGSGTVLADNPMLTCRLPNGRNPIRIICDTRLQIPIDSRLVQTANQYRTIIASNCTDKNRLQPYLDAGCEMINVPLRETHINLNLLMKELGRLKIDSLILEGGSLLNWAALQAGIINKVQTYISPKLFGGDGAKSPIGGNGVETPCMAYKLTQPVITQLGEDILLESEVFPCLQE